MLTLKIEQQGCMLAASSGEWETTLVYALQYAPGDQVIVECDQSNVHLLLQLDDAMPPAVVYLTGNRYALSVPFEEKRVAYSPRVFSADRHVLYVRMATSEEIKVRRNLALNPWDAHENTTLYPHAAANVETRGESVFAARNAIDGVKASHDHGPWPFQSWGINQNPDAELTVSFGREVLIDEAVLYLRADFPHDAWWERATLTFSDGSSEIIQLQKTAEGQRFRWTARAVQWIRLHTLIKADDPSPFPALTQVEFWGAEKEQQ